MTARRVLKGGLILTAGNMVGALASFTRNIIVARLISVEDFGIAALLALSMSFVEMVSNLAIDRILVQARDGDSERMQSTGHAFQAARGVMSAVVLFLAAEYIALFFNVASAAWAFQVLAAVPAIRGFIHLDSVRYQREMEFGASAWIEIVPQVAALALAVPLGIWLGDYSVMLWIILLQTIAQTVLSHLFATRKYTWSCDRSILSRMVSFGWPLMVNGLLMFIIFQGDKAIVGAAFTMKELGWYSAAFMLALAPAMIATKVLQSLLLPHLSNVQNDAQAFGERYLTTIHFCLLIGLGLGVGLAVAGPGLLLLLYGERYSDGVAVMSWLGLMQGVRTAKVGPIIVAMSLGRTSNPMYSNLVRIATLIAAVLLVWNGAGIIAIVIAGLIGEIVSFGVSLILLKVFTGLRIDPFYRAILGGAGILVMTQMATSFLYNGNSPETGVALGSMVMLLALASYSLMLPNVVKQVQEIFVEKVSK